MKSTTFKTREDMIDYFEIQKDPDEVDVITDHLPEPEKCCTICEFSEPGDGCGANDLSESDFNDAMNGDCTGFDSFLENNLIA